MELLCTFSYQTPELLQIHNQIFPKLLLLHINKASSGNFPEQSVQSYIEPLGYLKKKSLFCYYYLNFPHHFALSLYEKSPQQTKFICPNLVIKLLKKAKCLMLCPMEMFPVSYQVYSYSFYYRSLNIP